MKNPFRKKALLDSSGNQVVNVRNLADELRLYNGLHGSYEHIWKTQPAVRRTVDFLARSVARLNAKVYERTSDTDRRDLHDHDLAKRLRNPNPQTTQYRHWYGTVSDLAIFDICYWVRMQRGGRVIFVRVPVMQLTPVGGNFLGPEKYRLPDGTFIPASDVIAFPGYDPEGMNEGVSPMESLRRILAEDYAAGIGFKEHWEKERGIIKRPADAPVWSDTAREHFWERWRADTKRGEGMLEDGMDFVTDPFSVKDAQYIEARELTDKEVTRAFHIPLAMVGLIDQSNWGVGEYHKMLYTETLPSWLERIQQEVNRQEVPNYPDADRIYVEFDVDKFLKGSIVEEAQAAQLLVGRPPVTTAEWRARQNLPFIEGTDELVIPMTAAQGNNQGNEPTGLASDEPPEEEAKAADPGVLKAKAAPAGVLRRRDKTVQKHEKALTRHFERQRDAALGGKDVDTDRWNKELHADLFALGVETATDAGKRVAQRAGGEYDEDRTLAYIDENARIAAESINTRTADELKAAVKDADEPLDAIKHVFEVALEARVTQLALSRTTSMTGFGRQEAAKQNDLTKKTWVVTNPNSRHPELDGETVEVGEAFSNGLQYPGDPDGDAAETAGCECLMDLA